MDTKAIMQSLKDEINATKDRVRNIIGSNWQSDGLWKESIIRSVLRRYLPATYTIGTGFVIAEHDISTQIDIIIYDAAGPTLFKDGDFVIVTPDITVGVIEVKTKIHSPSQYKETIQKIAKVATLLRFYPRLQYPLNPFIGLFIFENSDLQSQTILEPLKIYNSEKGCFEIQCICLGANRFVRFWKSSPQDSTKPYNKWHLYEFENLAPGYFIHNVMEHLFPKSIIGNSDLWYPPEGKELNKIDEIKKEMEINVQ